MDSNAREELDALVRSGGWKMFTDYVKREWGPGGRAFEAAAVAAADDTKNPHSIAHLQQIIASRREILRIVAWPDEQLKALEDVEFVSTGTPDYSRRGGL